MLAQWRQTRRIAWTAFAFLILVNSTVMAEGQDEDLAARALLVEAIRMTQIAEAESDIVLQLKAWRAAKAALLKIKQDYALTDTGIELISGSNFGEFDPALLEEALADAEMAHRASREDGVRWSCTYPVPQAERTRRGHRFGASILSYSELAACLADGFDLNTPLQSDYAGFRAGSPVAAPLAAQGITDPEALRLLLSTTDVLHGPVRLGRTLLHVYASRIAANAELPADFLEMVSQHVEVDATDDYGMTALHYAIATNGSMVAIDTLLTLGADPNFAGPQDMTTLHIAARHENPDVGLLIVERLLEANADIEAFQKGAGTPLLVAIKHDQVEIASRLLDSGARTTPVARGGTSALFAAIYYGVKPNLVARLLAVGADPNEVTRGQKTILHLAAQNSTPDIARLLITAGADPTAVDRRGRTPADLASDNPAFDGTDIFR